MLILKIQVINPLNFLSFIGKEVWADGSRYEGNYFEGMKHGKGLFIWADGSTFEGDFKYNNIEGFGKLWIVRKRLFFRFVY